ncbi:Yps1p [Sugiyamaella lignohabitans]|uniref:Yps1p n=1 Tax=Sugiyamaella lignohabitans TaxID=796027 RepID=A0A161HF64_9ASCO|nr:Yps1p [Sugiyamaella lignohabitans]ANB11091.1 Yps1p [Sugiyamaella lignohabitans]
MFFQAPVAILTLATLCAAAPANHKGYLSAKTKLHHVSHGNFTKRSSSYETPLGNDIFAYVISFEVGTPPQPIEAAIDTGSADLWIYTTESGQTFPFDTSSSSTYQVLNDDFQINYVSGSASGDWAIDTVNVAGASLTNQQFGSVSVNQNMGCVFGIGYQATEYTDTKYTNIPQNLVDQGYTAHNAYSLYLDDIDAGEGAILFGAVDSDKYSGQLYTVPITSSSSLQVTVSGVTGDNGDSLGGEVTAVLDSGTSLTYLPQDTADSIANYLGATFDSSLGAYLLSDVPTSSITYSFSGALVTVPGSELAIPSSDFGFSNTQPYTLSIFPNSESADITLLGQSFLRSAYVVYDLDSNQISIAQSSWNSDSSNIHVITDSVPGAVSAPGLKNPINHLHHQ